jgi:transporter family protein
MGRKMPKILSLSIIVIISWGIWGVLVKVATQRIGMQTIGWVTIVSGIILILYLILSKKLVELNLDKIGITCSILSGIFASIGVITFYTLLKDYKASLVIPLTSLYPGVVVILSILILGEKITLIQILGIICALIACYLLSL